MTTEPPRGLKANLQRSYSNVVTQETYNELTAADSASKFSDGVSDNVIDPEASQHLAVGGRGGSPTASASASAYRGKNAFADNRSTTSHISYIGGLSEKQNAWRNLLFGLCFFHAVV